jgi:hypothetical protein
VNRETARVAVLAACCVVAIALASATLPTPTQIDSSGDGESPAGGDQFGLSDEESGDGLLPSVDQQSGSGSPGPAFGFCQPAFIDVDVLAVLLGGLLAGGGLAGLRAGRQVGVVVVVTGLVVLTLVVLLYLAACDPAGELLPDSPASSPSIGDEGATESGSGDGSGETVVPSLSLPSLAVVVLLALGLAAIAIGGWSLVRATEEDEQSRSPSPTPAEEALGAVAGETADDLDAEPTAELGLENAIYRAWAEMTAELPVDHPEASTPAEFERAAIEAGLDAEDVAELTALFETVRYGDVAPTAQREQQAIALLRRIEQTTSPDGGEES